MGEINSVTKNVFFATKELNKKELNEVKKCCDKVMKSKDKMFVSASCEANILDDLISILESAAYHARIKLHHLIYESLAERGEDLDQDYALLALNKLPKAPVEIDFSDERFAIKTPLTLYRGTEGEGINHEKNWILMDYVKTEIIRWQLENPDKVIALNENYLNKRLVLIIKRKALEYERKIYCDNDNIENSRIQNALYDALGISDNCLGSDYYSCFRIVDGSDDCGTEFIITPVENLTKYI